MHLLPPIAGPSHSRGTLLNALNAVITKQILFRQISTIYSYPHHTPVSWGAAIFGLPTLRSAAVALVYLVDAHNSTVVFPSGDSSTPGKVSL